MPSRRNFVAGAISLAATRAFARKPALQIGITDWNLNQTAKLEAVALASQLGFEGVQVSLGQKLVDNKMPLDDAALQERYVAEAKRARIAIDATCLDILHINYLKNDPLGRKWVSDGIRVTKALRTQVMLLPFFGKGALQTAEEVDRVGGILRELAPEAEKAGVILGVENTVSAEDNLRILDRAQSKAVKVYYDVGNSTAGGFDIIKEIRTLGPERICQFHFKDEPNYLGEGKIDFPLVIHTILTSGYRGFANLETSAPSHSIAGDLRRNLAYVQRTMQQNS
jgi:sugar phosphate isomerase/epimerase